MNIFTTAKISPTGKVNITDIKRWGTNALIFVSPAALIYLTQVLGILQGNGHVISWADFVPSTFTLGAIASWFVSTLIDFFRKLKDGTR